jgi:hypothetical protein
MQNQANASRRELEARLLDKALTEAPIAWTASTR